MGGESSRNPPCSIPLLISALGRWWVSPKVSIILLMQQLRRVLTYGVGEKDEIEDQQLQIVAQYNAFVERVELQDGGRPHDVLNTKRKQVLSDVSWA